MPTLEIRLLGQLRVTYSGDLVETLTSPRLQSLLAYLLLHLGTPQSRQYLAFLFWPDSTEPSARTNLRRFLYRLRQALPDAEAYLHADAQTVRWSATGPYVLDVADLEDALDDVAAAESRGDVEAARQALQRAVDLYAGDLLPSCYDDWIIPERGRLRERYLGALQQLAQLLEEAADHRAAIEQTQRLLLHEPLHEPGHRRLMRLLAMSGQRSLALAQYETCARLLEEELGVEPADETRQLYEQIRDGELPAALERAQVGHEPLQRQHNLPASLTPLIGRGTELAQLERLLEDPAHRLITLSGPGGSGKTRLALELAKRQVGRYPYGVHFVGLAGVGSVEAIVPTVADAIGASLYGGADPLQQLVGYLREQEMLLVLDNYEHLLSGVGVVVAILEAAPGVQVLVTSRARLGVRGEQVFAVEGLDLPEPDEELEGMARRSAVQLFVTSARWQQPGFALTEDNAGGVARACRLVEGMPLGIMLAAAWVEMLAPDEIAAQIERDLGFLEAGWRDVPARQRSMRAVLAHSWGLLSDRERAVMGALAVFRGGFEWEAAQEVAGASLRDLKALVDRSLLHAAAGGRYEVHELLRQFAAEKLCLSSAVEETELDEQSATARGRECLTIPGRYCVSVGGRHCAAVRDRHCAYYAEFLSQREEDVTKGYLQEVMREVDNIRAAWEWAVRRGKTEEIQKSAISLCLVYEPSGWVQEAAAAFGAAADSLRRVVAAEPTETREVALGLVLAIQSFFSRSVGSATRAEPLAQEGLSLLRRYGPRRELALCMFFARFNYLARSDSLKDDPGHQQLGREMLAISQQTGFYLGTMLSLRVLRRYEEALQLSQEAGDRRGMALALRRLGENAYARHEHSEAKGLYEEALAHAEKVGVRWLVAQLHTYLGKVAVAQSAYERAREHYQQALAQSRHIHRALGALGAHIGLGRVALALDDCGTATGHFRQALMIGIEPHFDLMLREDALRLDLVVGVAALLAQTDQDGAVELAALSRHHGASTDETRGTAQQLLDGLRARATPAVFAAAQERGRTRDLEATLKELLAEFAQ